MSRRCGWCRGEYPDTQAREVYTRTAISGPEHPVYACETCIRDHGLLPRTETLPVGSAAFIGRVGLPPALATEEQPPKICSRCGRVVTSYTAQGAEEDHGPVEVVWCLDAEACNQARSTTRARRSRLGMMLPRSPG